ncbi:MAG: ABC transporter ATP-binding protein [Chloroflexia bacterium]
MDTARPLVEVQNLVKYFPITRGIVFQRTIGYVRAVDNISFDIYRGETLGLVGESGCGKTTAGRTIVQLYPATSGRVIFDGVDLMALAANSRRSVRRALVPWVYPSLTLAAGTAGGAIGYLRPYTPLTTVLLALAGAGLGAGIAYLSVRAAENNRTEREMRRIRRRMQIIFQDPFASLNPRWTVNAIISEPLRVHRICRTAKERTERVVELLELVGLNARHVNRFPHEFSGGQRQRIGIARALATSPDFVVCDEPISALDVSIQAQVVNLLEDLQDRLNLTYLFIAHDLSMVRHICDRVAVMYVGKIVELAPKDELYDHPLHPYTQALLTAVPVPDPAVQRQRKRIVLTGEVPSPANPPPGCRFSPRCPAVLPRCREEEPVWQDVGGGHWVACHRV